MTEAYQCDSCGEFGEGSPEGRVLQLTGSPSYDPYADLCKECFKSRAEGATLHD